MNIMRKLALKSLQNNRKRTIVTIVGIILSTALITAVANMTESLRSSLIAYEKVTNGDYHYYFHDVSQENLKYFENNRNIAKIGYEEDLGYAPLSESANPDKPYLFVKAMNRDGMQAAALKLLEGRMPEKENELVVSGHVRSNGNVQIAVGDVLELPIGCRETGDGQILKQDNPYSYEEENFVSGEVKQYTVVGIIERPDYKIENYIAPGYTAITCLEDTNIPEYVNLYISYTSKALKNREQVTAGLIETAEEIYLNESLVKWELLTFSDSVMCMLYSMAAVAVLIIITASVFCIHNSFVISLTEKMRWYGIITSLGSTSKQRRKMVYTEAACLAFIGIPLGILCGTAATFIVVKATSHLLVNAVGMELVYVVSIPAMAAGVLLGIVTIFLSAGRAAGRAGKLSPISAVLGRDTVKMEERQLRVPGFVYKLFGIGGTIAYKNMRRSRGKYRTTVISIVVSVAIFIAMTTFVKLAFRAKNVYYMIKDYQMQASINGDYSEEIYQKALEISQLEGVTYAEVSRSLDLRVLTETLPFSSEYLEDNGGKSSSDAHALGIGIISLGEEAYQAYCEKVGVDAELAKEKAILAANYWGYLPPDEKGNSKYAEGMMYDYRPGDVMTGFLMHDSDWDGQKEISIELAAVTDIRPLSASGYPGAGFLIVSDEWLEQYEYYINDSVAIYLQCKDADALEPLLPGNTDSYKVYVRNIQREYNKQKSLYLLTGIFLYGFITVIALIGITNIFNTVTTNMELRSREFAILKSVGMTGREFKRLIQLETLFYGMKSLLIGIPVGIFLSFCFHKAFVRGIKTAFSVPFEGILISVIAVFLLLSGIMRYSMGKIGEKNIIETIQNENI